MARTLHEQIAQIQASLTAPYPGEVGPTAWTAPTDSVSNLLRSGPRRKAFVLHTATGDHDYEETMSDEVEFELTAGTVTAYKQALVHMEAAFGTGQGFDALPDELLPLDEEEDDTGRQIDGIAWTGSYDGGAVSPDCRKLRCWQQGADLICLQAGQWQGDGNFALFVVVTVTPAPAGVLQGCRPRVDSHPQPAPPPAILALQQRLGHGLEELPEAGEPGTFFPRDVMSMRWTYARNADGTVTGLNLAGADLVDLAALEGFGDLERLNLDDNALRDVAGLSRLPRLRELSLRANLVAPSTDLGPLAERLVHPVAFTWEAAAFG